MLGPPCADAMERDRDLRVIGRAIGRRDRTGPEDIGLIEVLLARPAGESRR
jgi:hypothetical protein